MDYLDCELRLTGPQTAQLSAGDYRYEGRTGLDGELEKELAEAEITYDYDRYGRLLFDALLDDEMMRGYRDLRAIADREHKWLRFRLAIAAHETVSRLHRLHWEYLFDANEQSALACAPMTAFSRYLSVPKPTPDPVSGRLHLLIVTAAPSNLERWGLDPLDRDEMERKVKGSLERLGQRLTFEVLEPPATLGRIRDRLIESRAHALLVQGHGLLPKGKSAGLALENDQGELEIVKEEALSKAMGGLHRQVRLVVLAACNSGCPSTPSPYSGIGPALVHSGVSAVVAMRRSIGVEDAAFFLEHFFRNLGRHGYVDAAVNEARTQLQMKNVRSDAWGAPVLFMRLPDARLWQGPSHVHPGPGPDDTKEQLWEAILERLWEKQLIPVLGPGITSDTFLSNEDIALEWAEEFQFPWNGSRCRNLPHVAWYVDTTSENPALLHDRLPKVLLRSFLDRQGLGGDKSLMKLGLSGAIDRRAKELFNDSKEPHRILAELHLPNYVTTNIDNLMTTALRWCGRRDPQRVPCRWKEDLGADLPDGYGDLRGTEEQPLVFHLYGNDDDPLSIVLTEDNYLDFLRALANGYDMYVPDELRGQLSNSMLLFLGYRIQDLDCRVLFRGVVHQLKRNGRGRTAVLQLPESDRKNEKSVMRFFENCCSNIDIKVIWGKTVSDFLIELRDRSEKWHG